MSPLRTFAASAILLSAWTSPANATQYYVTELGPPSDGIYSTATALNDAGNAVGYSPVDARNFIGIFQPLQWNSEGTQQPPWIRNGGSIRWDDLGKVPTTPTGPGALPRAINNSGQIVGQTSGRDVMPVPGPGIPDGVAFVWSPGQTTRTGIVPDDAGRSEATDINDTGKIVGSYEDSQRLHEVGFIWSAATGPRALGFLPGGNSTRPNAINNAGMVVGTATRSDGREQAFVWDEVDGIRPLGTLAIDGGSSSADAINNLGQVVGMGFGGAYLWDPVAGFASLINPRTGFSAFHALGGINDFSQVVGTSVVATGEERAFIWDPTHGRQRLDELVLDGSGWTLDMATDVNNAGQIVGIGHLNGERRGFLLTPVPEPGTLLLAALGAMLAFFQYRFRK